jgi:methylase of polypeptide subunit release factors
MADPHRGAAFDLIGERYEKTFVERAEQWRAGQWLLQRVPSNARVLDLGCGSGCRQLGSS